MHGLRLAADHRPERGWRFVTPAAARRRRARIQRGHVRRRPAALLPIRGRIEPPANCCVDPSASRAAGGTAAMCSRDYYVARAADGARCLGVSGPGREAAGICRDCGLEPRWTAMNAYAELHALSNFSFLRGASHPAELIDAGACARLSRTGPDR